MMYMCACIHAIVSIMPGENHRLDSGKACMRKKYLRTSCIYVCMYAYVYIHIYRRIYVCTYIVQSPHISMYCDLQNNCKFDRPLKNAWMRGIPIQLTIWTDSCRNAIHQAGPGPLDHWTTYSTHRVCIDYEHTYTKSGCGMHTSAQRSMILF